MSRPALQYLHHAPSQPCPRGPTHPIRQADSPQSSSPPRWPSAQAGYGGRDLPPAASSSWPPRSTGSGPEPGGSRRQPEPPGKGGEEQREGGRDGNAGGWRMEEPHQVTVSPSSLGAGTSPTVSPPMAWPRFPWDGLPALPLGRQLPCPTDFRVRKLCPESSLSFPILPFVPSFSVIPLPLWWGHPTDTQVDPSHPWITSLIPRLTPLPTVPVGSGSAWGQVPSWCKRARAPLGLDHS